MSSTKKEYPKKGVKYFGGTPKEKIKAEKFVETLKKRGFVASMSKDLNLFAPIDKRKPFYFVKWS